MKIPFLIQIQTVTSYRSLEDREKREGKARQDREDRRDIRQKQSDNRQKTEERITDRNSRKGETQKEDRIETEKL